MLCVCVRVHVRVRVRVCHPPCASHWCSLCWWQEAEFRFSMAIQHNPSLAQYYLSRARTRQLLEVRRLPWETVPTARSHGKQSLLPGICALMGNSPYYLLPWETVLTTRRTRSHGKQSLLPGVPAPMGNSPHYPAYPLPWETVPTFYDTLQHCWCSV